MGIIKKQSIQSTLYNYLGIPLGFLNSAILMPMLLTTEQVGLLGFLNSFTSVLAGLFTLGIPLVTIKIFPKLRDENKHHHGFFSFSLISTLLGCVIGLVFFWIFKDWDWFVSEKNAARQFAPFAIGFSVLLVVRIFAKNFDSYIRMLMNTVLGTFTENFLLKFAVFVILGVYWWVNGYAFTHLFFLYVFALSLPGLVSIGYVFLNKQVNLRISSFNRATKGWGKEIMTLSAFGLLGSLGSVIILEVDRIMVSNMLGLEQNAVYTTAFFFGLFCSIPARALRRISSVVVAEAWEKNDLDTIKDIYYKSSLNLFLFGVYLFLGVWVNIDYIFQILPEAYGAGKMVILIIGTAQLIDLMTGVNTEIISTSPYYKYATYFIAVLIVLVVILNYLIIPVYGINGAALASLVSIAIYNLLKYLFLQRKLSFQPFNSRFLLIITIGFAAWAIVAHLLPSIENLYLGILITGSTLTILYWVPVYLLKVSADVNQTIDKYIK